MQDPTRPPTDDADGYRAARDAYLAHACATDRDVLLWPDGTYTIALRLRHLIARDMLHVGLPDDAGPGPDAWRSALVRRLAAFYLR